MKGTNWDYKAAFDKIKKKYTNALHEKKLTYLNREDLYSNIFAHQLGLPNTTKAPPSFDFQQL